MLGQSPIACGARRGGFRKGAQIAQDIRWVQRLNNFKKSLRQLSSAMALMNERKLSELEKQGVIQAFEYNYELAWNVLKDFYQHQGDQGIQGSRDAIKTAFKRGLIANGDLWMAMIKSRALTSHAYNEDVTAEILRDIVERYHAEFVNIEEKLTHLACKND